MTIRGLISQRVFLKVDADVGNAKVKLSMFAANAMFHCMLIKCSLDYHKSTA